ncbi:MAG: hypothetical protein ABI693_27775 [Bryobacteraceae bacterium]
MADQLYLSYWLRGFTEFNMLRHLGLLLQKFPVSRLAPDIIVRVHAVALTEPFLMEQQFGLPLDIDDMLAAVRQHRAADIAVHLETKWDIWQKDTEWKLAPAPVSIYAFGPAFERERDENIRIDFGPDFHFLPDVDDPSSARLVQSNVRSLLSLVHSLDDTLAADRRQLWSESGENFAERLQAALQQVL